MSQGQQVISQILQLSEDMVRHAERKEWQDLQNADKARLVLVHELPDASAVTEYEKEQIAKIRSLQGAVMQLLEGERSQIKKEYVTTQGKLAVSNSYLNNMANTTA